MLGLCLPSSFAISEAPVSGGFLSPDTCGKRVLYMVSPMMPRHVVLPESGCSVTVKFEVGANGKLQYPLNSNVVPYEERAANASVEPPSCSTRYMRAVLKSLPEAQFDTSEQGYSCTYRYNWVLEP